MNLHRLTVKINGEKEILIVKDIVSFLSAIDAQNGTLANSGMEHLMKNKIEIEDIEIEKETIDQIIVKLYEDYQI